DHDGEHAFRQETGDAEGGEDDREEDECSTRFLGLDEERPSLLTDGDPRVEAVERAARAGEPWEDGADDDQYGAGHQQPSGDRDGRSGRLGRGERYGPVGD